MSSRRLQIGAWFGAAAVCSVVFVAPDILAQETISDPERPAIEGESSEDEDAGETTSGEGESASDADDSNSSGAEVIVDPENPLSGSESRGDGAEVSESADEDDSQSTDASDGEGSTADVWFSAGYGSGLWVDTRWDDQREDIVEWRNRADLALETDLSSRWSARLSAEFYHWMAGGENPEETDLLFNAARSRAAAEFRLGESYVLYRADRFAFRAGHLVNSWGSTDLIRPGDVVNPVDATEWSGRGGEAGRLLPQPAVELSYLRPNWSVTGLVIPFFAPHRVTVFGNDSAVASGPRPLVGSAAPWLERVESVLDRSQYEEIQPLLLSPSAPDEEPKNVSLGVRWTGTRWNTDFGFGYLWGWDRTPSREVDGDLRELARLAARDGEVLRTLDVPAFLQRNPRAADRFADVSEKLRNGEQLLRTRYKRRHTILFDVARYIGPIGVRADLAMHPERTFVTESLETVRRPTVFGAVGVSYERVTGERPLAVTVEGFWLEPFGIDAAPTRWFVSESERGRVDNRLVFVDDPYRGVAGAFDWTLPWADLEVRLGGLIEIGRGGVVFDGSIGRTWAPWFRTMAGLRLYEGPYLTAEESLGGLYDPNDQVGVRVEGRF